VTECPQAKALLLVHSETSTGVLNDVAAILRAVRPSPLLVMVDCVSSIGGTKFELDEWDVDVAITASQKCLMSSPGLSFVALSERAWAANQRSRLRHSYFDFQAIRRALARARPETPGTAPVHLFCQVNEALSLIHEEGLAQTLARHQSLAQTTREWATRNGLSFAATGSFSPTLTAICFDEGVDAGQIRELMKQHEILIARGLGPFQPNGIRVGHLGDIRRDDVDRTLNTLSQVIAELEH